MNLVRKNTIIADITPEGKPIKIEKKIRLERISVTIIVTTTNEINENIIDRNKENFRLIKK
jgi:hypothetical protein